MQSLLGKDLLWLRSCSLALRNRLLSLKLLLQVLNVLHVALVLLAELLKTLTVLLLAGLLIKVKTLH